MGLAEKPRRTYIKGDTFVYREERTGLRRSKLMAGKAHQ